jgi:hypothetical protein
VNKLETYIQQYLQQLLIEAASYRKKANQSKTQTTKNYYMKKLNKLTPQIQRLVLQLQTIQPSTSTQSTNEHSTNETNATTDLMA